KVSPESVDFGPAALGDARGRVVTITGSAPDLPLGLLDVAIAPPDAGFVLVEPPASEVPADGGVSIPLRFAPEQAGPATAALVIATNDIDTPIVRVPLTGNGLDLPPCAFGAPTTRAFGNVLAGSVGLLPLLLANEGEAACLL